MLKKIILTIVFVAFFASFLVYSYAKEGIYSACTMTIGQANYKAENVEGTCKCKSEGTPGCVKTGDR